MDNSNDILAQYGVGSSGPTTGSAGRIRDQLGQMFSGTDFVRVRNPDTEKFSWVYTNPSEEQTEQGGPAERHIYYGTPRVYTLEVGESRVIEGGNAYVMIDALVKKLVQKKSNGRFSGTLADPRSRQDVINSIYLGKEDIMSVINGQQQPSSAEVREKDNKSVLDDLGLEG